MRKNRNIIMNTDTMLDILLSAAELFPIPCPLRISFSIHYCMDRITDSLIQNLSWYLIYYHRLPLYFIID